MLETLIRGSHWASTLTVAELDHVLREAFERRIPAGGYALRCGDPAELWIGVIDGLLKLSLSQPDGLFSTFTGVAAGGWAGEGSLLRPGRWRYDAVAMRDSRIACVPRSTFERLVATNPAFNRFLLLHLNARLSLFIGLAEYDRLLGPEARVARCVASLFDPDLYPAAGPTLPLTEAEIALLAAVPLPRAREALRGFERAGLLLVEAAGVTVFDLRRLRAYRGPGTDAPNGHSRVG